MTDDLHVPEASRRAFAEQHGLTLPGESGRPVNWAMVDTDIRKIVKPAMAAELRRLVAELRRQVHEDPPPHDPHDYLDQITGRADYLAEREEPHA